MQNFIHYVTSFDSATSLLVASIEQYGIVVQSIAVFLFGEAAVIISLLLTQQGLVGLKEIFIASMIGSLAADIFWFFIGRYYPQQTIPESLKRKLLHPVNDVFTNFINNRIFLSLIFLKFFFGVRLIIILYFARHSISWGKFLVYNFFGTLIYMFVLTVLCVFLGKFINNFLPTFHALTSVLSGILIIVLLSMLTKHLFFVQPKEAD
ncbi:VTT domain-containing protein [Candidatus Kaiserbacteria bacterium]|nr:VTT domain-containing protein [Candidatus Kaiserbacteria bacterium]